jgi:UDP-N-acetylmuramate: L-alanyl-gamma-D-glutamyl-meso-diaminopimelate ligase
MNGLSALAAASAVGVDVATVIPRLAEFVSVKRRMEHIGDARGVTLYDDFAHHPTAIRTTLEGLRARVGGARIVVAMEPRSASMRLGAHAEQIAPSLAQADAVVFLHRPELAWDAGKVISGLRGQGEAVASVDALVSRLTQLLQPGDYLVFMSNGGFEGAPLRTLAALQ